MKIKFCDTNSNVANALHTIGVSLKRERDLARCAAPEIVFV